MGDRISIQFKNGEEKSVVLFNHWGGMEFLGWVKRYLRETRAALKSSRTGGCFPLGRFEPGTVMVDFISWYTAKEKADEKKRLKKGYPFASDLRAKHIVSNLYLGADEDDGDNSDNGHHVFDLLEYAQEQDKYGVKKEDE